MFLLRFLRPGRRAVGVLAGLLLLLLGLVSASAMRQVQDVQTQVNVVVDHTLPALRLARELQAQLDDLRGMSALQLSSAAAGEREALAARMRAQRLRIDRQLAAPLRTPPGAEPGADQPHREAVQAGWARYGALHERLLQISRQAEGDAAAGRQARSLLAGEAQQAYQHLRDALERWCEASEQRAEQARRAARAAGESAAWHLVLMVALAGLAAAAGGAWGLWEPPLAPRPPSPPGARGGASAPGAQARAAAVQAVVQAARDGGAAPARGPAPARPATAAQGAQPVAAQGAEADPR